MSPQPPLHPNKATLLFKTICLPLPSAIHSSPALIAKITCTAPHTFPPALPWNLAFKWDWATEPPANTTGLEGLCAFPGTRLAPRPQCALHLPQERWDILVPFIVSLVCRAQHYSHSKKKKSHLPYSAVHKWLPITRNLLLVDHCQKIKSPLQRLRGVTWSGPWSLPPAVPVHPQVGSDHTRGWESPHPKTLAWK